MLANLERHKHEVYNDTESLLTDFFVAVRDHTEELKEKLQYTPYSRVEYERAVQQIQNETITDVVERARLFFVLFEQSRYGRGVS